MTDGPSARRAERYVMGKAVRVRSTTFTTIGQNFAGFGLKLTAWAGPDTLTGHPLSDLTLPPAA